MEYKMMREERAKQFMPFAALKGYAEALKKKERMVMQRKYVSEEYAEELDRQLRSVQLQDEISVIYYHGGEYLKITGAVKQLDSIAGTMMIGDVRIPFADLYAIERM